MESTNPLRSVTIRDRFVADHRRIDALLERLIDAFGANDSEEIGRLWSQLEPGLLGHLEAEEKYMLPAFANVAPEESAGLAREHEHFRLRLSELGAALDLHLVRLDTARAFADELRDHARKEDGLLYRWADTNLDPGGVPLAPPHG
jgi:hemerythrin superfamily protein